MFPVQPKGDPSLNARTWAIKGCCCFFGGHIKKAITILCAIIQTVEVQVQNGRIFGSLCTCAGEEPSETVDFSK